MKVNQLRTLAAQMPVRSTSKKLQSPFIARRKGLAVLTLAAAFQAVAFGNVCLFDQQTDTARIAGHTELGGSVTAEAWVLFNSANQTNGLLFNEYRFATEDKQFMVGPTRTAAFMFGGSSGGEVEGNPMATLGQWTHMAYVYDGSEERVYANGTLITQEPAGGDIRDSNLSGSGDGLAYYGYSYRNGERKLGLKGFVRSFRLSTGVLYTGAAFVVPPRDLPVVGSTIMRHDMNVPIGSSTVSDPAGGHTMTMGSFGFPGFNWTFPAIVADPIPERTLEGTITGLGLVGNISQLKARVRVYQNGNLLREFTNVPIAPDGTYRLAVDVAATVDVSVNVPRFLSTRQDGIALGSAVTTANFALSAGDIVPDEVVDLSDYTALAVAFNATPASGNWNPLADLNLDGIVDLTDYTTIAVNFNMIGNP